MSERSERGPVPAMTASDTLGYRSVAERREVKRFPVLATQIRCSSGFTHAPRGRLEVLAPTAAPIMRAKGKA